MSTKTRKNLITPTVKLIGPGKEFILTELPTLPAILQYGIYLRDQRLLVQQKDRSSCSDRELAKEITLAIVNQWKRANTGFQPPVVIDEWSIIRRV